MQASLSRATKFADDAQNTIAEDTRLENSKKLVATCETNDVHSPNVVAKTHSDAKQEETASAVAKWQAANGIVTSSSGVASQFRISEDFHMGEFYLCVSMFLILDFVSICTVLEIQVLCQLH